MLVHDIFSEIGVHGMKNLSRNLTLNLIGGILAVLATAWILLGSSVTNNTPVVRVGSWTPAATGSNAP